jgi:hypothetical protein
MKKGLLVGVFLLSAIIESHVYAGPPLLTGDPYTPDAGHWEINVGCIVEKRSAETLYETPVLDLNYGLTERIQLTFDIPWLVLSQEAEKTRTGPGNSLIGVKWRFLDEKTQGVSVSVFPQVEFNNPGSSSADRGLVDKGSDFLLPLQLGKGFGPFGLTMEFGYVFKENRVDEWIYGLALGYALSDSLQLLAEINGTALNGFEKHELVFNMGTIWKFSKHCALLASAGTGLHSSEEDAPAVISYLGVQFTF